MNTRQNHKRSPRKPGGAAAPQPARGAAAAPPPAPSPARPVVIVPAMLIPDGAGGWNVRPGKPVILAGTDEITVAEAARILGHSTGYIACLCDQGVFKTARKKNPKPRSMWLIARAEVMDLLNRPAS